MTKIIKARKKNWRENNEIKIKKRENRTRKTEMEDKNVRNET